MKTFLTECIPVIMTFVSGGFFWEFARYMFFSGKQNNTTLDDDRGLPTPTRTPPMPRVTNPS